MRTNKKNPLDSKENMKDQILLGEIEIKILNELADDDRNIENIMNDTNNVLGKYDYIKILKYLHKLGYLTFIVTFIVVEYIKDIKSHKTIKVDQFSDSDIDNIWFSILELGRKELNKDIYKGFWECK
jgi:hypothetical protein